MRRALWVVFLALGIALWSIARSLNQHCLNGALIEAVIYSDAGRTQRLIQEGASANSRQEDVYGIADLIRHLRREPARRSGGRPSALMIACSNGDVATVKILLEAGADVNARRQHDVDALFDAIQNVGGNGSAIIRLLASHGAKLDLNTECGRNIWSSVEYRPEIRHTLLQLWPDQRLHIEKRTPDKGAIR